MPEVHLVGEVVGGANLSPGNKYIRFRFLVGEEHWHLLEGSEGGYTQVDTASGPGCAVWNHPIDAHFGTDALEGWPQVMVEAWTMDSFDRSEFSGYGLCYIPPAPGLHELNVALWRPAGQTMTEQLSATFLGARVSLRDPEEAMQAPDRSMMEVETCGHVSISIAVIVSGFRGVAWGQRER